MSVLELKVKGRTRQITVDLMCVCFVVNEKTLNLKNMNVTLSN